MCTRVFSCTYRCGGSSKLMLNIFLDYALPYALRQGFSLETQNSEIQLVNKSSCSGRLQAGLHTHPSFTRMPGFQTPWVLVFIQQALHPLSHLPAPCGRRLTISRDCVTLLHHSLKPRKIQKVSLAEDESPCRNTVTMLRSWEGDRTYPP